MPNIGSRGYDLQEGESITLFASAARLVSAGTNGTAVYINERTRYIFLLNVTAVQTDATDTLDVYIDFSLDGTNFYNGGRFTQVAGNGAAIVFYTVFDPTTGTTADTDITSDQAESTFVPSLFGPYVRGRYVITEGNDAEFTFSLTGYAI